MPLILRALLLLVATIAALPAAAANCTVTAATTGNLGSQTSYTVQAGTVPMVTAPAGLTCPAALLNLLSADYARATATSAKGFKLTDASGNAIAYQLSADSTGRFTFTQGSSVNYIDPQLLTLLGIGIGSGGDLSAPLYAKLTGTTNLPAGVYTDTVTLNWAWSVCRGIGALGVCVLPDNGSGTTVVTVTLVVTKDCRITAPNVSFGSAPLVAQFSAVTQSVAVACTKGATYTVSFTSGAAGNARPWRAMRDGAGNTLQYNLYRADGSTIWDESNPLAASLPGTGALSPDQTQAYVARINPTQVTPPAGSYTDTISVVVTY